MSVKKLPRRPGSPSTTKPAAPRKPGSLPKRPSGGPAPPAPPRSRNRASPAPPRARRSRGPRGAWFKVLGLALLGVLLIACGLGAYLYYRLQASLPQVEGTLPIRGLTAPVEVLRDIHGVPHLYGADIRDIVRAQGFVHAQDRFFQMEVARRAGSGRLAEVFGPEALPHDRLVRRMGLGAAARAEVERMGGEAREVVEAYASGVNAYLEEHAERLPPELQLLGIDPVPWEAVDTLAIGKWLALFLSENGRTETLRHNLIDALGVEAAYRITGLDPPDGEPGPGAVTSRIEPLDDVRLLTGASNAWVLSGERSRSGRPLLASDPHLMLSMPSIWYEAHLSGGGYDVAGASVPGMPLVLIGQNRRIAWGATALFADVQDLYLETPNPESPSQYAAAGEWVDLEVVTETIQVKDQSAVREEILVSRNGVITGRTDDGKLVAQRWEAPWTGDHVTALLSLNRAGSWQEFTEALRSWASPALAFVYADVEGNIGFFPAGSIPVRRGRHGVVPVDRASSDGDATGDGNGNGDWDGVIPHELKPMLFNPEDGVIVTANHSVLGPDAEYPFGPDTLADHRARRIESLLPAGRPATLDDFARIQNDRYDPATEPVLRFAVTLRPADATAAAAVDELRNWSGVMTDGAAPAIYYALYARLLENTFRDELGDDLFRALLEFLESGHRGGLHAIVNDESSPFWDDRGTAAVESRADVFAKSLDEAVALLTERYGADVAAWDWRVVHGTVFRHPLGAQPPLDRLFNRGPVGFGGSTFTVANAVVSLTEPFETTIGTSFRLLVDLSDLGRSRTVVPTGASGHPLSEHYFDQSAGWLNGESHPLLFERREVEAGLASKLILQPRAGRE